MEGGNPKITSEISTSAIVGSTYDASSHPNEIKQEFPLSDPNSHGGFVEHTIAYVSPLIKRINVNFKRLISSAYTGTNLKLEMEDEVKPEVTSEPAFVDPKSDVSHPNEIKKEFPFSEPHSHGEFVEVVKHENSNIQSLNLQIKSEVPDLKCGMKSDNDGIYIQFEPLVSEELDMKNETRTGKTPFKCSICDYRSAYKSNIRRHIKSHMGEKPLKCNICDYRSTQKDYLERHMQAHTGENRFKCRFCDYTCLGRGTLRKHMRTHTSEKLFICNICDYRSIWKSKFQIHMKIHTGDKPFKCNVCDYRCIQKGALRDHMKTHTGERPFKCNVCGYRSRVQSSLQTHMKTHTGEKPFKCNLCDYRCIQKSNLGTHIKTHTGEKTFKCNVCDYRCRQTGRLQIHTKAHTKK